jgi:hypothetical protein
MEETVSAYAGPNASLSDEEFIERYESCVLTEFTHEDHLRMAFAYARKGGAGAAVGGARRTQGLAQKLGAPGKYHDTMTVAWARVVGHLAARSGASDFEEFLLDHPQLHNRNLMSAHYSRGLMFSPAARAQFIEPDLVPLP